MIHEIVILHAGTGAGGVCGGVVTANTTVLQVNTPKISAIPKF